MEATFFFGNGFDLQLGMKTSYSSFLQWYLAQPNPSDEIADFKKDIHNDEDNMWSDAEIAIGKYLGKFEGKPIGRYLDNVRHFTESLGKYLSDQQQKQIPGAIFERGMIFHDFILNLEEEILCNYKRFVQLMPASVQEINYNFLNFNYTSTVKQLIEDAHNTYVGKHKKPLSFGKKGNIPTKINNLVHIHGSLDKAILMGVDRREQLIEKDIVLTEEHLQKLLKPAMNTALGRIEPEIAKKCILSSDILVFFGLSFGETDRTWWHIVKQRLETSNACVILCTHDSSNNSQSRLPEELIGYTNTQTSFFMDKMEIYPDNPQYRCIKDRIFVIRNTQKLVFKESIHV